MYVCFSTKSCVLKFQRVKKSIEIDHKLVSYKRYWLIHVLINLVLISFHLKSTIPCFTTLKFSCLHNQYCMEVILILMVQRPFYKGSSLQTQQLPGNSFWLYIINYYFGERSKIILDLSHGLFIGENWSFIWNNSQITY